jgi:hypothetical protein
MVNMAMLDGQCEGRQNVYRMAAPVDVKYSRFFVLYLWSYDVINHVIRPHVVRSVITTCTTCYNNAESAKWRADGVQVV